MLKKAILLLGILFMVFAFTYAEEKFTISGEVTFQYDGDIYVFLLKKNLEISQINMSSHHPPNVGL